MKTENLGLSELTNEEYQNISGGSGATYSAGWLIGAALAMPLLLIAAGAIAITSSMGSGYDSFDRSA